MNVQYKAIEAKKRLSSDHNEASASVNALNINIFLQEILNCPEKLKAQTIVDLLAIYSIFDIDNYIEIFLAHVVKTLGNLMLQLVKVNWCIIPDPSQYIPLLIKYTFDVTLDTKSYKLRLTLLSQIVENEISRNNFWDECLSIYVSNVTSFIDNKEAMIVFALCCIHEREIEISQWEESQINDIINQILYHISECDLYSDIFLQSLEL